MVSCAKGRGFAVVGRSVWHTHLFLFGRLIKAIACLQILFGWFVFERRCYCTGRLKAGLLSFFCLLLLQIVLPVFAGLMVFQAERQFEYTALFRWVSAQQAKAEEIVPGSGEQQDAEINLFLLDPDEVDRLEELKAMNAYADGFVDFFLAPHDVMQQRFELSQQKKQKRGDERPMFEVFSGVDATENQIGFYAGGVTGALGDHINLKGVRLRAVYGQGVYEYTSSRDVGGGRVDVTFVGRSEFYEAMVGYEFRLMGSIFKLYGGVVSETNHIDPRDVQNDLEGQKIGAKVLLEAWRDLDNGHWFSGYGSFTDASEYYTVHGRYGLPLYDYLDIGIELGAFGNQEFDALRFGAFSRYKHGDGEWTFSAGVSGDYDQPDAFYGTIQYFTKLYLSDMRQWSLY